MEVGEDGTWTVEYVPEKGDVAMYATTSDGVYDVRSDTVDIVVETRSTDDPGTSSLAIILVAATCLAVLVTVGVMTLLRRD